MCLAFTTQAYFHEKGVFTNKKRLATGIPSVFSDFFILQVHSSHFLPPSRWQRRRCFLVQVFLYFVQFFLLIFLLPGKFSSFPFPFGFFWGRGIHHIYKAFISWVAT